MYLKLSERLQFDTEFLFWGSHGKGSWSFVCTMLIEMAIIKL